LYPELEAPVTARFDAGKPTCFAKASHAARSSLMMILIFTYLSLVVVLHYIRDTVSAKRQENRRRLVEVRFHQLSNETPLVGVKLSQLIKVIVSVIWLIFFSLI
jgi:hypothetical protein